MYWLCAMLFVFGPIHLVAPRLDQQTLSAQHSSISQKTSGKRLQSSRALRLGRARVSRVVGDEFSPSRTSSARFSAPNAKKIQGKDCFGAPPKVRSGPVLARETPAHGGQAVRYSAAASAASVAGK